jgi:hypothetical protein
MHDWGDVRRSGRKMLTRLWSNIPAHSGGILKALERRKHKLDEIACYVVLYRISVDFNRSMGSKLEVVLTSKCGPYEEGEACTYLGLPLENGRSRLGERRILKEGVRQLGYQSR